MGSGDAETKRGKLHAHMGGNAGVTYVLASVATNFFNFLFAVVVSRQLGPSAYGAASALLNVITVVTIPLLALQAAVVQEVVGTDELRTTMRRLYEATLLVAVGATVVVMCVSPFVAGFLALGSVVPVIVLATWLLPSIAGPVLGGALVGRLRFHPVAVALVAGAFVRLVVAGALGAVGSWHLGIEAPVIGTVVGAAVTTSILVVAVRSNRRKISYAPGGPAQLALPWPTLWQSLGALTGYSALVGVDTVVARHYMAAEVAGDYASAATAGRIALFLPAAVTVIVFPRLVAKRDHPDARRDVFLTAAIVGGVGIAVALGMALLPHLVILALFGHRYTDAAPELRILGVEAAMLGLISLFTYFHLSRRSAAAGIPWLGAIVAAGVALEFRPRPLVLATIMLVVTAATVGAMALIAWVRAAVPMLADRSRDGGDVELSVVIPHFNPGPRLVPHVADVLAVLGRCTSSFEVIVVSDGTTDGSDAGLEDLAAPGGGLSIVRHERNMGKGEALRTGFNLARGRYVGFIDGDGDIPASLLESYAAEARNGTADFIVGSKRHRDSQVESPLVRRVYSAGFRLLVVVAAGVPRIDTQTGIKLMRREVVEDVLPLLRVNGFAFDLELMSVASRYGYSRVVELPVVIQQRYSTTVSMKAVFRMLSDTLRLGLRLRVLHSYDRELRRRRPELFEG
ncbi:MAG TPA: glycosyltransferase, partial [Acidimicrobiales bacterium]|nr:glycosyltransferase [Acidimicrobiales bacterium]